MTDDGAFRRDERAPQRPANRAESADDAKLADERAATAMREHLAEIGAVLDLPTKRPTRATGFAAVQVVQPAIDRRRLRRWLSAAIVAVGTAIAAVEFWPENVPELPTALLGEWTTTHADYAGKRLIFKPDAIEIGVSESALPNRFQITALVSTKSSDTTRFGLTYQDDGGPVELHATLIERAPAQLVMERPAGVVWERRFPSAAP